MESIAVTVVCFFIFGSVAFFLLKIEFIKNLRRNMLLYFPLWEFYGGSLMVLCWIYYGNSKSIFANENWRVMIIFAELILVNMIAWNDFFTMKIPNPLIAEMLFIALVDSFFFREIEWKERTAGFFCVSIPMILTNFLISGAFGGGDSKLMAAGGLFLGWKKILLAFIVAVLCGGGYSVFSLFTGKKNIRSKFAFGPFLCIGIMISLFWGEKISGLLFIC